MIFFILLFITSVTFSESLEDQKEREYANIIIEDQKIYLSICSYYEEIIKLYCTQLLINLENIPDDSITILVNKVTKECSRDLYKYEKEYKKLIANMYMQYYTLKELKELEKFYKSSLGAKLWQAQQDIKKTFTKMQT